MESQSRSSLMVDVGTPVVSELYKHVIYISHANEEGYWGTNPGRCTSAGSVGQRSTLQPLNASLDPRVCWGTNPRPELINGRQCRSTINNTTNTDPMD